MAVTIPTLFSKPKLGDPRSLLEPSAEVKAARSAESKAVAAAHQAEDVDQLAIVRAADDAQAAVLRLLEGEHAPGDLRKARAEARAAKERVEDHAEFVKALQQKAGRAREDRVQAERVDEERIADALKRTVLVHLDAVEAQALKLEALAGEGLLLLRAVAQFDGLTSRRAGVYAGMGERLAGLLGPGGSGPALFLASVIDAGSNPSPLTLWREASERLRSRLVEE